MIDPQNIAETHERWQSQWPQALKVWSDYVKLREPVWCTTAEQCRDEGIQESFAMIRLNDHRIVIDISRVVNLEIEDCALQVLAHEIGHHIYTPANLKDNAVILAKIRWVLIGIEKHVPMVANLYEDLLINDRLHRGKGLDMAIVYKQINKGIQFSKLWTLYMRSYEYLWKLKRGTLATGTSFHSAEIDADASLIASIIRSYSKNWLDGAARFAAMLYPYLMDEQETADARKAVVMILDTEEAGKAGGIVPGMCEIDPDILNGVVDPRGEAMGKADDLLQLFPEEGGVNETGGVGPEQRYLNPGTYVDLMQQVNPNADEQQLINTYYKEAALSYLIDFPVEKKSVQENTLPEGMETWDVGDSVDEIDWVQTAIHAPQIFPGINTLKRTYGPSGDEDENMAPLNVYLGIDCSGSMVNPKHNFSWPVLAATIIGLSALRAGSKVMGCLSGEPGSFLQTEGFVSLEKEMMTVITSYLGTGYAYGVKRLNDAFSTEAKEKSHIVIVTDDDIFAMLGAQHFSYYPNQNEATPTSKEMWDIIESALKNAGGTGTIVLHSQADWHKKEVARLKNMGWRIHYVTNQEQLVTFAETFAKANY